ncbi:MAG: serine/threonine protein kinase [Myxococcales bacterium]|nr:serine/threonine protein kinase [Myxococcales bacterium]
MSQERFVRCPHCNLPHEAGTQTCPVTGEKIELKPRRGSIPPPQLEPTWRTPIPDVPDVEVDDSPSVTRLFGMVLDSKYRIDKLIGRGGMGIVYQAEHTGLRKKVAVKVLLRGHGAGSEAKRRFEREARMAGSLGHPNIVQIFDLGSLPDGSPYLVMELLQGESLADRLKIEGALPVGEACDIVAQVLSALEAAHDRGIVHRDLKPDNVFLSRDGVKLLDFGISKNIIDDNTLSLTRTGIVVGTPYYLAPEQARGERNIDQRVDLWAAGVLLYESLTGMLPFTADNYNALIAKILTKRPESPAAARPSISPMLESVIMKALAYDPKERFRDAADMRFALLSAKEVPSREVKLPVFDEVVDRVRSEVAELGMTDERTMVMGGVRFDGGEETEISDGFSLSDLDIDVDDGKR